MSSKDRDLSSFVDKIYNSGESVTDTIANTANITIPIIGYSIAAVVVFRSIRCITIDIIKIVDKLSDVKV